MVYDPDREQVVLFGGKGEADDLGDTWLWDGAAWTAATPPRAPEPRFGHGVIWDPLRHNVVLFGGSHYPGFGDSILFPETWTWNGTTWTQMEAAGPLGRSGAVFVFDTAQERGLLYGGVNAGRATLDDGWAWDGAAWTELVVRGGAPAGWAFSATFDFARGETVLFGGSKEFTESDWTWVLGDDEWTVKIPSTQPVARSSSAMAFDETAGSVLLFGGSCGFCDHPGGMLDDTWTWDGTNWLSMSSDVSPSARNVAAMAWDRARQEVVLFGGNANEAKLADTWVWRDDDVPADPPDPGRHGVDRDDDGDGLPTGCGCDQSSAAADLSLAAGAIVVGIGQRRRWRQRR